MKTHASSLVFAAAPVGVSALGALLAISYTNPGLAWWSTVHLPVSFFMVKGWLIVAILGLLVFWLLTTLRTAIDIGGPSFFAVLALLLGVGIMPAIVGAGNYSMAPKVGLSALERARYDAGLLDAALAKSIDRKAASRDPATVWVRKLLATGTHESILKAHTTLAVGVHGKSFDTLLAATSALGLNDSLQVRAFRARGWATREEVRALRERAYGLSRERNMGSLSPIQQNAYLKLIGQSSLSEPLTASIFINPAPSKRE